MKSNPLKAPNNSTNPNNKVVSRRRRITMSENMNIFIQKTQKASTDVLRIINQ